MTPAAGSRNNTSHRTDQDKQATVRITIQAPSVHPIRPVSLRFSRGQVPHTPDAACAGHDPELWFSDSPEGIARAQAICQGCPGQLPCLSGALERRETYGIWGATDFNPAHQRKDVA